MSSNIQSNERLALSIVEAARACGLSRAMLYRLIGEKRLETVKIGSRRLVRPEALDALLRGGKDARGK